MPRFWAKKCMAKYLILFQTSFSQYLTYRVHILSQITSSLTTPFLMLAALMLATSRGYFSASSLVSYYLLISLIVPLTISSIDEDLDQLVNSGDINNYLLKPFSLFRWLYAKNLSEKAVIFLTLLPFLLIFIVATRPSIEVLLVSLVGILLSFSLSFTFSYLLGLFCFWVDEFWAIHNVKFVTIQLLGGIILPYQFFPESFSHILRYSPFPYLASWVPRYLQGAVTAQSLLLIIPWIIFLYILVRLTERLAVSKYSFTGS